MPAGFTCGLRTRGRTAFTGRRPGGACAAALDGEPLEERVRGRGRERLDEREAVAAHLADRLHHAAVVDGALDAVVGAPVADLQLDVVEEQLPQPPLLLLDAVVAEHLQSLELELHAA